MPLFVLNAMAQRSAPLAEEMPEEQLPDNVRVGLETADATPTQRRRVRSAVAAVRRAEDRRNTAEKPTRLRFTIDIEEIDGGRISLFVKSKTKWTNEGELGSDTAHLVLGPRGGVSLAVISRLCSGRKHYEDETFAFRKWFRSAKRLM